MPELFIQIFYSIKAIVLLLTGQQGSFASVVPSIILLAAVTIVTLVAGRFFCGWMCAFGSMGDFIYHFPRFAFRKKKVRKDIPDAADHILKWLKYGILFIFVVLIWGLQIVSIPTGTDPWELFGMLVSFGNWPSVATFAESWIMAAVILLGIMIASFFVERFFCRYLCPLGAYFSIISRLRPVTIGKERSRCGKCRLCSVKCSMGIPLDEMDRVTTGECINCMECVRVCPSSNAHLDLEESKKNAILAGTVSCALITGAYYLGNIYNDMGLAGNTSTAVTATQETSQGAYSYLSDGTYTGSGTGFRGETTVDVTVESGVITDVSITSAADDAEYLNKASSAIISEIISGQTTDVDTVSGATYSSKGIIAAVENALSSSGSESQTSGQSTSDSAAAQTTQETDTQQAQGGIQDTENAAESGSTASADASESVSLTSLTDLKDGTYTGSGTGLRGETDVTVTVSGGKITDITIDSYQDDQQFFERAESTVVQEIIDNQSVNVDAVSGATYSSNSIKEAVANALSVDYTPSTIQNEGHGGEGGGQFGGRH
jgi:uncharacterized protein with FMN-binding domain/ferredoxin